MVLRQNAGQNRKNKNKELINLLKYVGVRAIESCKNQITQMKLTVD